MDDDKKCTPKNEFCGTLLKELGDSYRGLSKDVNEGNTLLRELKAEVISRIKNIENTSMERYNQLRADNCKNAQHAEKRLIEKEELFNEKIKSLTEKVQENRDTFLKVIGGFFFLGVTLIGAALTAYLTYKKN